MRRKLELHKSPCFWRNHFTSTWRPLLPFGPSASVISCCCWFASRRLLSTGSCLMILKPLNYYYLQTSRFLPWKSLQYFLRAMLFHKSFERQRPPQFHLDLTMCRSSIPAPKPSSFYNSHLSVGRISRTSKNLRYPDHTIPFRPYVFCF